MRMLVVARGVSAVPAGQRPVVARALNAWRVGGGGAWETFVFPVDGRAGFGVVAVPDAAALARLLGACPLAPFCSLETVAVGPPAGADRGSAPGRVAALRARAGALRPRRGR